MNTRLLSEVEQHVREYCKREFPEEMLYHNLFHIEQVVDYVNEIAPSEGLSDKEQELALLAAWFHDIGIPVDYADHEAVSADHAADFLSRRDYDPTAIERVKQAILATRISTDPKSQLDFVLRDADSLHLGKLDFFVRMMALREEMRLRLAAEVTEQEILKASIMFYRGHKYYTHYAREHYGKLKSDNLERLEQMYHKYFGDLEPQPEISKKSAKKRVMR